MDKSRLYGFEFYELHYQPIERLNELQAINTLNRIRQNLRMTDVEVTLSEAFISQAMKRILRIYNQTLGEAYYTSLRGLCDTQEKFNLVASMSHGSRDLEAQSRNVALDVIKSLRGQ